MADDGGFAHIGAYSENDTGWFFGELSSAHPAVAASADGSHWATPRIAGDIWGGSVGGNQTVNGVSHFLGAVIQGMDVEYGDGEIQSALELRLSCGHPIEILAQGSGTKVEILTYSDSQSGMAASAGALVHYANGYWQAGFRDEIKANTSQLHVWAIDSVADVRAEGPNVSEEIQIRPTGGPPTQFHHHGGPGDYSVEVDGLALSTFVVVLAGLDKSDGLFEKEPAPKTGDGA